ncbi:MAG: hypothetical protein A2445_05775 [Candidatus Jacksonbacteria bacterium RIFOXYC2_FULL_44_29]|nr:MAG: hypothetical protein UW45_C0008G0035 [Parcubacteria group bacterium GW2011_GWC2_44_22]OGY76019.1 MAG: hypothetical protein A2240_05620 [Candidatus Jacksonbacteria bacterium RIFOXYA2_FULL_43_12]OGY76785.1 MAG: hypothetical protein A2295_00420 [Candidatus Jacksonbacteria bacterium RIFOXYB2_FULL_44_15]OGY79192.1 MAG: hypothetical protein A2445_05775 [Candidatus Jacksonbacteria bacterium RIFOXYC2_FULL_44_29]OGY82089.1 MAG: hypothetical protein A2550_00105 [Candidatus Jacksonbacteria bacteri
MPGDTLNIQLVKAELEKERLRILKIFRKRAHKDPKFKSNYVTDYPDLDDELGEVDGQVFEEEEYEVNLAVEHILEKRLQQIDADLKKIEAGTYAV